MAGASRVEVSRENAQTPQLQTRAPTFASFVGVAEMGPIGSANVAGDPISSWAEWQGIYGGFTDNARALPLAVKCFFDEGGRFAFTSRTVHCNTPGDPLTKTSSKASIDIDTPAATATQGTLLGSVVGPFVLDNGLTLSIIIDANSAVLVTFAAAAASRTSVAGPFGLVDGETLIFSVNGAPNLTKTFTTSEFVSIAAATPTEVVAAVNGFLLGLNPVPRARAEVVGSTWRLITTSKGTGSSINIVGGTANSGGVGTKFGFTTGAISGTGDAVDIGATTVAELKAKAEPLVTDLLVSNVGGRAQLQSTNTGTSSIVQVQALSTADDAFGFDNAVHAGGAAGAQPALRFDGLWDGTYARLTVIITSALTGDATRKDIAFQRAGITVESWRDASFDPADPLFVETLINQGAGTQRPSRLLSATYLDPTLPSPSNMPANGSYLLTGGNDGLSGLVDADYYGTTSPNGATGLYVFNQVDRIDIAAIPGRCNASTHNQLVTWCEISREGRTYHVLAVPSGLTVDGARTYVTSTAALKGSTEIGSIYAPWVWVDNPSPAVFGPDPLVLTSPEGSVVGMFCRVDASKEGGAFEHPAGALGTLRTVRKLETREYEDISKRGLAVDDRINPIRAQRGRPIYVDGSRTLLATGPFPTVGESRGAMLVSNELVAAYDRLRHAGIRPRLYTTLTNAAVVYLGRLTAAECFATKREDQAYFVDFGPGLNTPDVVEAAEVIGVVGLNTAKPAELILLRIVPFRALQQAFLAQVAQLAA